MTKGRLILLTVALGVVAAMATLWSGSAPRGIELQDAPAVPVVGSPEDVSSSWFCSAGTAPGEPVTHHVVYVANTSDKQTQVRVSAYGEKGLAGEKVLVLEGQRSVPVNLDAEFKAAGLSAMVEAPSGAVAVNHWVGSSAMADTGSCQRQPSPTWYFPSQTTLSGTTAQLVLFNPFSADAGVDITAAVADGIRSPSEWVGVVVPAGTSRTVDLSEQVQRRDQFSLTVEVRSGRLFAETVQTFNGVAVGSAPAVTGLRLSSAVAEPSRSWMFAGGFSGSGASEVIVIQNPGSQIAEVQVQVTPNGDASLAPEPFTLKVPAKRYSVLDLTEEGRVPNVGFHSVTVEANPAQPVVAQRQIRLFESTAAEPDDAEPEGAAPAPTDPDSEGTAVGQSRPSFAKGVGATTGTDKAARQWWLTAAFVGGSNKSVLFLYNPNDSRTRVDVIRIDATGKTTELVKGQELGARSSAAVSLAAESPERYAGMFKVTSTERIAVEGLTTMNDIPDFGLYPAFPLRVDK